MAKIETLNWGDEYEGQHHWANGCDGTKYDIFLYGYMYKAYVNEVCRSAGTLEECKAFCEDDYFRENSTITWLDKMKYIHHGRSPYRLIAYLILLLPLTIFSLWLDFILTGFRWVEEFISRVQDCFTGIADCVKDWAYERSI